MKTEFKSAADIFTAFSVTGRGALRRFQLAVLGVVVGLTGFVASAGAAELNI